MESLQKAASKECSNDLKHNPAGLFEIKEIARTNATSHAQYVRKSVSENMQTTFRLKLLDLLRLEEKSILNVAMQAQKHEVIKILKPSTSTSQTSPASSGESKSNHAGEDLLF